MNHQKVIKQRRGDQRERDTRKQEANDALDDRKEKWKTFRDEQKRVDSVVVKARALLGKLKDTRNSKDDETSDVIDPILTRADLRPVRLVRTH